MGWVLVLVEVLLVVVLVLRLLAKAMVGLLLLQDWGCLLLQE